MWVSVECTRRWLHVIRRVLMHLCLYSLGRHLAFRSQMCVCVCMRACVCTDMSGGGEEH